MPSNEDVHEAVEAALRKAPESAIAAAGVIAVSWPIAVSNNEAGSITVYSIFRGNECGASQLLDIGGSGVTRENGIVTISLNDFQCVRPPEAGGISTGYGYPVNVVATPIDQPAMLSVQSKLGESNVGGDEIADVLITVSSWGPNGQALGSVGFNWRCIVPTFNIVD
jgi:hypothetical protein